VRDFLFNKAVTRAADYARLGKRSPLPIEKRRLLDLSIRWTRIAAALAGRPPELPEDPPKNPRRP